MKYLFFILTILLGIHGKAQPTQAGILAEINRFRAEQGLAPAKLSTPQNQAAEVHAKWCSTTDLIQHEQTRPANGMPVLKKPWDRGDMFGATVVAENLFAVHRTATSAHVVAGWKASAGHRENLLYSVPAELECRIGIAIVPLKSNPNLVIVVLVVGDNVDHRTGQIQN